MRTESCAHPGKRQIVRFGSIIMVGIALVGLLGQVIAESATESRLPVLFFGLCSDNVLRIEISSEGAQDSPVMIITLTAEGRKEFFELTKKHLGRELDVVFDGVSLARAKIRAEVDSGVVILSGWRSEAAVRAMGELIRDDSIDAPCGPHLKPTEPEIERGKP